MSASKDKGRRGEHHAVKVFEQAGVKAQRVPLSGSLGGEYTGDIVVGSCEHPIMQGEVKYREGISNQLWNWLQQDTNNDFLVVKKNHKQPLVLISLDKFAKIVQVYVDAGGGKP